MTIKFFRLSQFCLYCLILSVSVFSVNAMEVELTESVKLSGKHGRVSLSPYQLSALERDASDSIEYKIYAIDYGELKRQIKIYQQIYVTGQLLHGYLMVKMKPKFVN